MSFTACQVDQIQFSFSVMFVTARVCIDHFDPNGEDSVGPESLKGYFLSFTVNQKIFRILTIFWVIDILPI